MRLGKYPFILFYLLLLLSVGGCAEHIKEPSVAGSFYPSDPKVLRNAVDRFLAQAEDKQVEGKLIALLSPHAGYLYSGRVAAHSYRHLKGKNIETVILIGPSHHKTFNGASVYTKGVMRTPLGDIKINEKIARSLINENAHIRFYPEAFEKEHSLEVQLPFLQVVLKDFTIVPILISSPTKESYEELTKKLIGIIGADDKTILVASTDLSHYHDYDTAVKKDSKTIDVIERMAIDELEQYLMTGECEMCG
ncbi:MAG: AmmeMemoRadiSam system protein B, partial [Nitrospirae bacterium]|nr:AmmeMemoRadiSam system protein B [Nitrospirota bacterium]